MSGKVGIDSAHQRPQIPSTATLFVVGGLLAALGATVQIVQRPAGPRTLGFVAIGAALLLGAAAVAGEAIVRTGRTDAAFYRAVAVGVGYVTLGSAFLSVLYVLGDLSPVVGIGAAYLTFGTVHATVRSVTDVSPLQASVAALSVTAVLSTAYVVATAGASLRVIVPAVPFAWTLGHFHVLGVLDGRGDRRTTLLALGTLLGLWAVVLTAGMRTDTGGFVVVLWLAVSVVLSLPAFGVAATAER